MSQRDKLALGPVELRTARARLLTPHIDHAQATLDFFERNRAHLIAWDPPAPRDFHTLEYWRRHAADAQAAIVNGSAVRLNLFASQAPDVLAGRINFTQINRGAFWSCMLGYSLDASWQGKGLMHECLESAIAYMFDSVGVHRIQANYQPENVRSGALLARLGFAVEGHAAQYLFINGRWRDHVLTALVNRNWQADQAPTTL
jgi:ribosomal-protein-alanine N-acetyltransferase